MSKNNSYNYFKERKYWGAENHFTFYVANNSESMINESINGTFKLMTYVYLKYNLL
jgi:hypothetical protein